MSREPWCILKDPYGSLWIHQEGHQDTKRTTMQSRKGPPNGSTMGPQKGPKMCGPRRSASGRSCLDVWTMRSANEDARAKMKIAEQVQMADRIRAHGHIS